MHESDPLPVPGHESLSFSGERVALPRSGHVHSMRLARLGEDSAVLVFVGSDRQVWSRRIDNAFSTWPPAIGEAVVHPALGMPTQPTSLTGSPDGTFSVNTSAGWIYAHAGEPGTRCALPQPAFGDSAGGVYTFFGEGSARRLLYRATRTEAAHVRDLGPLPARIEPRAGCVTGEDRLMLPFWIEEGVLRMLIAKDGQVEVGQRLVAGPASTLWAIPRSRGGVHLAIDRRETVEVLAVDEDGRLAAPPWIQRNVSSSDHLAALTAFRDGFAVCTTREKAGFAVSVSDGAHTTFGRGEVKEDLPLGDQMGLVSGPDGRRLLFAGAGISGPLLFRVICGPGDPRSPFIPAPVPPPPPRPPARAPLESLEKVMLNVRQRVVLAAFASLSRPQPCAVEGDARTGAYYGSNEQGAHFMVHWDETGLVALGFSHTDPKSEARLEVEERRPGQYLVGLPAEMRPLALRAIACGNRLATEGLWIAAATDARGRAGTMEVLAQLGHFDPGDVWLGGGAELSALAGRIAGVEHHRITKEEERLLFQSVADADGSLELGRVEAAAATLSQWGVEWPSALEHARERGAIREPEPEPAPESERGRGEEPWPRPVPEAPRPPPTGEPLLDIPDLDTTSSAAETSALLERAEQHLSTDTIAALRALLAAWRLNRNPRLAELAEALALRMRARQADYFTPAPFQRLDFSAVERALRAELEAPPDPTTARLLLAWLRKPNARSTPGVDRAVAELLVHARDIRFIESLEQHTELGRPGSNSPTHVSLIDALDAMQRFAPGPLSAIDTGRVGRMEQSLLHSPPRELLVAVYEHPEDDAPRRELAARFVEMGDPRGELITLQLERHATGAPPSARETALLEAHGREWLGEIGPILGENIVFERGFLSSADTRSGLEYPILASGGGTQWEWSTVRRLDLSATHPRGSAGLLRGSRIRGLTELVQVSDHDIDDLLHGPPRRLLRLEMFNPRSRQSFPALERRIAELPDKLPELRVLSLSAVGELSALTPTLRRLPRLRELSVRLARPSLAELAGLGRELGLAVVTSLGRIDYAYDLDAGRLTVTFPHLFDETYGATIATALASADPKLRELVVMTPRGAHLTGGETPTLERDWDSLPLAPVVAAAHALGLPVRIKDTSD